MADPLTFPVNGVQCTIAEEGGIVESWPAEGRQATVYIKCDWADRQRVLIGLRGTTKLTGTTFEQVLPMEYPDAPGLFCTSVGELQGLGLKRDARGWGAYKQVVIPANFTRPTWGEAKNPKQDNLPPFTSVEGNAAPEVFAPPGGAFYMPDMGQEPVGETTVGLVRPHVELTMTRKRLPYPPLAAIMFLEGSCNNEPIRFYDRIFPRGTLLFMGATFEEDEPTTEELTDAVTGLPRYDVQPTFTLKYKFLGNYSAEFNTFMGRDGDFHFLNSEPDGSGFPPIEYQDHLWFFGNNLDPPEQPENFNEPTPPGVEE